MLQLWAESRNDSKYPKMFMKMFMCSILYIQRPIKTATIENKCPPPAQTHTHTSVTEGRRHSTLHSWYYSGFDSGLWAPRHWYFNKYRGNNFNVLFNTGLKSVMERLGELQLGSQNYWNGNEAKYYGRNREGEEIWRTTKCSKPLFFVSGRTHKIRGGSNTSWPHCRLLMREEHCNTAKNLLHDMSPLKYMYVRNK